MQLSSYIYKPIKLAILVLFTTALTQTQLNAKNTSSNIPLSPIELLGKSIFEDTDLSLKRNQACASCHASITGFSSPREDFNSAGAVMEGSSPGKFANAKPPSISYSSQSPVLHHRYEDKDLLFVGGNFWNGRASGKKLGSPIADQAQGPFLSPLEMGLPDSICVVARVCNPASPGDYPVKLTDWWGSAICDIKFPTDLATKCADPAAEFRLASELRMKIDEAYDKIALSIAAFEASPEVNSFSSKYDRFLIGQATLTAQEQQGLHLFQNKAKCANCHILTRGNNGQPPLLTDFTYDNLGVPRNPANPFYTADADTNKLGKNWREIGLTEFLRTDILYQTIANSQIGKVKVPSLRNVDKRPDPSFIKAFMHNGYFKSLKTVVHFYNTRDIKPRCNNKLTPVDEALLQNCWPEPEVTQNVNKDEMGDLKLSDEEEDAVVAFLQTLTDLFNPTE